MHEMALRRRYLFVCTNRRADDDPKGCCAARGSEEIRAALKLNPAVPLVWCDARDRSSSKQALIKLVQHAMARLQADAKSTL